MPFFLEIEMRRPTWATTVVGALLSLLVSTVAIASVSEAEKTRVSIGGYSPVSYFTEGKAERGSPEFAVKHDDNVYFLTSAEQLSIFAENPDKYRPRHRACTYSLAYGMVTPLDPTNFKIIGDTLLLFHRSEEKDALLEWTQSELSPEELLRRADANVFLITF